MSDLVIIKDTILSVKERFEELTTPDIHFQKELQFAMQLIEASSYLASVCVKNPESLKHAVMNISAIGLSLNPATKLAYLVPRGGKVCLDISYMGLARLATDSGSILWVQAQIVRKEDTFIYHGVGIRPTHDFNPFSTDRGDMVGAYCIVKTVDGEFLSNPMSIDEIFDIRDRTEAYNA
jgi:recombination protein RecT